MRGISQRLLASPKLALGSLILIWLAVRVYPLLQVEPIMNTEVAAARKLLNYGFVRLHGARLGARFFTGYLPNPEAFQYTHYPFSLFWLFTLVYSIAGAYGVLLFVFAMKLAGFVLVFRILAAHFERFPAWFATALFAIAPCSIALDVDTDIVATGALVWPFAVWALLKWRTWLAAALTMFIAAQISWFALTLIPALMILVANPARTFREGLSCVLKSRVAMAILIAGLFGFVFYLAQVAYYEPDFRALFSYVQLKMGETKSQQVTRSMLFTLFPLRTLLFTGAALVVGILLGLRQSRRAFSPFVLAAVAYLPSFVLAALVIPHYFYMENMVYCSLLFPATVLAAVAVQHGGRFTAPLLFALALPGLGYTQLSFAVPQISPTSRTIARLLVEHTAPTDVILTNLRPAKAPFKTSDVHSEKSVRVTADRHIYYGIETGQEVDDVPRDLKTDKAPMVFMLVKSCPISAGLASRLEREAKPMGTARIPVPQTSLTLPERLRAWVWYEIMRKGKRDTAAESARPEQLEFQFYRLKCIVIR